MAFSFPHGLQQPTQKNKMIGRIVSDSIDEKKIYSFNNLGENKYFKILEIVHRRKAKGDWTGYNTAPDHYELKMERVEPPTPIDIAIRCS